MSTTEHELRAMAENAEVELAKIAESFGATARQFEKAGRAIAKSACSAGQIRAALHHPGQPARPFVRQHRKVGRNEICPCGSGQKYKRCHGAP